MTSLLLASLALMAGDGCATHGTHVLFHDSLPEAVAAAKKSEKLVFVLHVSGNFEDPRFT